MNSPDDSVSFERDPQFQALKTRLQSLVQKVGQIEGELQEVLTGLVLAGACPEAKSVVRYPIGPAFTNGGGVSWMFEVQNLANRASTYAEPYKSSLILCEDNKTLGPGNALHSEISNKGMGLYSHWMTYLLFSTSDNSDPNTNGRRYEVLLPEAE